jgi:hypothetical protein
VNLGERIFIELPVRRILRSSLRAAFPTRPGMLSSSVPVHQLPGLVLLPVAAPRPASSEAEDAQRVNPQPYALAKERPVGPPPHAREQVDHEQPDVDQDVGGGVRVETLEGLHAGMCARS